MPKLKMISAYAFSNCEQMKEIFIPKTVEMLDYRCFYNSTANVPVITIPYSVEEFGYRADLHSYHLYQQFYE